MNLIKQISYQNKVIGLRNSAEKTLKADIDAAKPLVAAYEAFDSSPESVIGTSDKNSKIVLDALPSQYDFPALTSSLEYILKTSGVSVDGITGNDESATVDQTSTNPSPVAIPFNVISSGDFSHTGLLIKNFENSIRPFVISNLDISGSDKSLKMSVKGITYYQPAKSLEIKQVIVPNGSTVTTAKTKTATTGTATGKSK